jgi:hypothetical protein
MIGGVDAARATAMTHRQNRRSRFMGLGTYAAVSPGLAAREKTFSPTGRFEADGLLAAW